MKQTFASYTHHGILLVLIISTMCMMQCTTPKVQLSAPYTIKEKILLGDNKVTVYMVDDTLKSLGKYRYIPVYRFDVTDEKGTLVQQYVGGYQEFLSRTAGLLPADQKQYIQTLPAGVNLTDSTRPRLLWTIAKSSSDINDGSDAGTVIKTSYWSLDKIENVAASEVFTTEVVSVPFSGGEIVTNRQREDCKKILIDGEDHAYYEMKRFVIAQLGKK